MENQQSLIDADYIRQAQETLQQAWISVQAVLDASLQQIQETSRELAVVQAQNEQLRAETEQLKHDLGQMQAQLDGEKQSAQKESETLREELLKQQEAHKGQIEEFEATLGQKTAQIAQFEQQLASVETQVKDLEKTLEARKAELKTTKTRLTKTERELEKKGIHIDQLELQGRQKQLEIDQLSKECEHLAQSLDESQQAQVYLTEQLEHEREVNSHLESENHQLQVQLQGKEGVLQSAQEQVVTLTDELHICRSDKEVLVHEEAKLKQDVEASRIARGRELVLQIAPFLADLSSLADLEPEAVKGMTARGVFERFRGFIEAAAGARVMPIPSNKSALKDLWLDPDVEGWEKLIETYDWSPDLPFEGREPGSRKRHFRVLRRGWQVDDQVLVRVRVALDEENEVVKGNENLS